MLFRALIVSLGYLWKNVSLKERKAHFLSLTQYSLGVELKFVECVNFCCWAWLKYAVTLKENPLNVTWFWWAWLKSLLTLIKNLLNVKTILLLEFCTISLSIPTCVLKCGTISKITRMASSTAFSLLCDPNATLTILGTVAVLAASSIEQNASVLVFSQQWRKLTNLTSLVISSILLYLYLNCK